MDSAWAADQRPRKMDDLDRQAKFKFDEDGISMDDGLGCHRLGLPADLPMPVSPSGVSAVSEIPAFHFRTCLSLNNLWIFWVWPATFKYWRAEGSETTKTPSMLHACSFFSNPFLEFCLSTRWPQLFLPPFCSTYLYKHLTLWKLQSIVLEPRILWKRWFTWAFCKHNFSCYAIFTKLMTLQIINLPWSDQRISGWPQFFQKQLFPSVPSLVYFEYATIFRSFQLSFLC